MANKANSYAKKAKKLELMKIVKGEADTSGQVLASGLMSMRDLVLVVFGGGALAAITGRVALPVGLIVTGAGYYTKNNLLQLLGAGTMAANNFLKVGTVQGLDGLDGVKERLQAYRESLKEKFFVDKLLKKKEATTSGIGEVQYFNYSDAVNGDLAALDEIENQLAESALEFQGTSMGEPDYLLGEMENAMY